LHIKGGYHFATTSRLWCYLTSILTNIQLENDIPEHDNFLEYAPEYELFTSASKAVKNKNTQEYIDRVLNTVLNNLKLIK
jgi:histone deacetylase HOS2